MSALRSTRIAVTAIGVLAFGLKMMVVNSWSDVIDAGPDIGRIEREGQSVARNVAICASGRPLYVKSHYHGTK